MTTNGSNAKHLVPHTCPAFRKPGMSDLIRAIVGDLLWSHRPTTYKSFLAKLFFFKLPYEKRNIFYLTLCQGSYSQKRLQVSSGL